MIKKFRVLKRVYSDNTERYIVEENKEFFANFGIDLWEAAVCFLDFNDNYYAREFYHIEEAEKQMKEKFEEYLAKHRNKARHVVSTVVEKTLEFNTKDNK